MSTNENETPPSHRIDESGEFVSTIRLTENFVHPAKEGARSNRWSAGWKGRGIGGEVGWEIGINFEMEGRCVATGQRPLQGQVYGKQGKGRQPREGQKNIRK